MLLFLDFGSRPVERSERSSQVQNKHWRLSSLAELLGHFILEFDLRNLEVAFRQDYRQSKFLLFFFCFADSITLFKKIISKKVSHLTCILIEGTFPSTNQHPCTFSCFISPPTHKQDALENAFSQCNEKLFLIHTERPLTKAIVVRRELRSCTCSWGHDVRFVDRRHLLQQTVKE